MILCTGALPVWLDAASAAGQAVGGFATLAGLLFAGYQFWTWKKHRLLENRSKAAASALPALEMFCAAVENWATRLGLGAFEARGLVGQEAIKAIRAYFDAGREEVERRQKDLTRVGTEAFAFLNDDEMAPLQDANGIYIQVDQVCRHLETEAIRASQSAAIGRPAKVDFVALAEAPLKDLMLRLAEILKRGRVVMRAIARHEKSPAAPTM